MSIFGTIMSKVFGSDHRAAQTAGSGAPPADTSTAPPNTKTADATAGQANTWKDAPTNSAGKPPVDVTAMLQGLEAKSGQKLDWRHSIVDLLKLLNMDSSHAAREKLADELHYDGDKSASAAMNMWLHKEVIKRITENGGKFTA